MPEMVGRVEGESSRGSRGADPARAGRLDPMSSMPRSRLMVNRCRRSSEGWYRPPARSAADVRAGSGGTGRRRHRARAAEPVAAPDRANDARIHLPRSIAAGEVARLVEARRRMWPADRRIPITCVVGAAEPCLAIVDAIARLALAARDEGRAFRLVGPSPALIELIEGCGLADALNVASVGFPPCPSRPSGRPADASNVAQPPRPSPRGARGGRTAGRSARCRGRT